MLEEQSVAVIVLNWNGWKDTINCLESVLETEGLNIVPIVVDNGSVDNSLGRMIEVLESKARKTQKIHWESRSGEHFEVYEFSLDGKLGSCLPTELVMIASGRNLGFAAGCNLAIDYASTKRETKYCLLLNNDAFVEPSTIGKLAKTMSDNPEIAALGPVVYSHLNKNLIQTAGYFHNWSTGKHRNVGAGNRGPLPVAVPYDVDFVSGAALMVKTDMIGRTCRLDEKYFAYWEDFDLCLRLKRMGWRVCVDPQARIWHMKSKSTSGRNGMIFYLTTRNMLWFMKENASKRDRRRFALYFSSIGFSKRIAELILVDHDPRALPSFLLGVIHGHFVDTRMNQRFESSR